LKYRQRRIFRESELFSEDGSALEWRASPSDGCSEGPDMPAGFQVNDVVVYRKQKSSARPGAHAKDIAPAARGDSYSYFVDKFWRVIDVLDDNTLVVLTRRGKQHIVKIDDPALRRMHWWERFLFSHRFPPRKSSE
jgi:hypothetical protein